MKTIAERVAELPEEERELHKDLIAECLDREARITENAEVSQKGIKYIRDFIIGGLHTQNITEWQKD